MASDTTYEIEMLLKGMVNEWEFWESLDERPSSEYCQNELGCNYCKTKYVTYRVVRIERTILFE